MRIAELEQVGIRTPSPHRSMPHNGSRISGEPSLEVWIDSTARGAMRHELYYAEDEGRSIEDSGGRDGLGYGSSVCIRLLCGALLAASRHPIEISHRIAAAAELIAASNRSTPVFRPEISGAFG